MENKRLAERRSSLGQRPGRLALCFAGVAIAWTIAGCGADQPEPPLAAADAQVALSSLEAGLDERRSGLSADAKVDTFATLVADLEAPRAPADGGGRAWIEWTDDAPHEIPAAGSARFEIVYEAGPLGVAEGGLVFLQPSPFWDWDPPQVQLSDAPGFTTVSTDAVGIELQPDDSSGAFLAVVIGGRALASGERIRFVYGAGESGARVDRFHEDQSPLYLAVDGDGDGIRSLIENVPRIDVASREAVQLVLSAPSTALPGASVELVIAALDALGSPSRVEQGGVELGELPAGAQAESPLDLAGGHLGHRRFTLAGLPPGTHRISVQGTGELAGLTATSNPIRVEAGIERILWGDLHGHSQLSDGTGTPDQYYRYARDVAALDVSALTDHDHWGMEPLDARPSAWQSVRDSVDRFHQPGRFVALLGYEWTNWLHGHRHVLYFDEVHSGGVLSSLDPRYQTPADLWNALRGQSALTFAHHSAGGPVSTNWLFPPDPVLEPVTEIVSVHGSSEAPDSPRPIYDPVPGNYVRDVVGAGYVLGFIGSGDSHDGHPGLVQLSDPGGSGGLAAIASESLTRAGVLEALRARRVYATNGPRIWLRVRLGDRPMGSLITNSPDDPDTQWLEIDVEAHAPIERIDLIRSGHTASIPGEGSLVMNERREIPKLQPGEYHYVRVVQLDGGAAWSSPIYAR
jgi:hypothetical protein